MFNSSYRKTTLGSGAVLCLFWLALWAAPAQAAGTFHVGPTGIDDTAAIRGALEDAVVAGPGSVVLLEAGTFILSSPIDIANFDGTFRGAGKYLTVIRNPGDTPFPVRQEFPEAGLPSMFFFYRDPGTDPTSITVSDMSVHFAGESAPWSFPGVTFRSIAALMSFRGVTDGVGDIEAVSDVSVTVARMHFEGETRPSWAMGYNVISAFTMWGEQSFDTSDGPLGGPLLDFVGAEFIRGTFNITGNHFLNMAASAQMYFLWDSEATFGGSQSAGNYFDNNFVSFAIGESRNSMFEISHNQSSNSALAAVLLDHGFAAFDLGADAAGLPTPSHYRIHQNSFSGNGFVAGVLLTDTAEYFAVEPTLFAEVTNNEITLEGAFAGILGDGAHNSIVRGNRLSGAGLTGIAFGLFGASTAGAVLQNNAVDLAGGGIDCQDVFPILLDWFAHDNTVVGAAQQATVCDFGLGNSISGSPVAFGSVGPKLSATLREKAKLLRLIRAK
jgi:hypothetical protein